MLRPQLCKCIYNIHPGVPCYRQRDFFKRFGKFLNHYLFASRDKMCLFPHYPSNGCLCRPAAGNHRRPNNEISQYRNCVNSGTMALIKHFFGICAKQECDCLRVLASFDKYHLVVAHLLFVNPLGMSEFDVDVPMMIMIVVIMGMIVMMVVTVFVMIIVLVVKFFRYCGACRFSKPEKIILITLRTEMIPAPVRRC